MKDLEKIKSEDLGCQVQDANPGNFAIEQEVAQLVGATVPAPTEPSADDARELGAQLLVFLRRALLPIRSALRTAVAAIYAHLDSRCTAYTPAAYAPYQPLPSYDPMGTPPTPRTLPNLLTALTAFSDRKIVLADAPDGIGLPQLLCNSDAATAIEEIEDPTSGWTMDKPWTLNVFPLKKLTLGCALIPADYYVATIWMNGVRAEEINFPNLKKITRNYSYHCNIISGSYVKIINMPELEEADLLCNTDCGAFWGDNLEEINMPKLKKVSANAQNSICTPSPKLRKIVFGTLEEFADIYYLRRQITGSDDSCPNLIHFEVGAGTAINLNLSHWLYGWSSTPNALSSSASDLVADPTAHPTWKNLDQFLQNFREHIALRLAQQPADNPNHLTLTLSQAVFDTIWNQDGTPKSTDPDSVIYQINKIIKTDKHWSVNRA